MQPFLRKSIYSFLFLCFGIFALFVFPAHADAADRYWIGGTGNWTDTAHWSNTSGGSGGQTTPKSTDDVFFDGNSGIGIATVNSTAFTKDFNLTGYTGTLAGSSSTINITGSLTLGSGMTYSYTGPLSFTATTTGHTLTFNGKMINGPILWNGSGGGWILQDDLIGCNSRTLTAGSLNTNNQDITTSCEVSNVGFSSTGSNARSLILGSSNITVGSWNLTSTNLTLDAGSSIITVSGSGNINAAGFSYNEFNITNSSNVNIVTLNGQNTFSILRRITDFAATLELGADQIVTNTLQIEGDNPNIRRSFISSDTGGVTRTITLSGASVTLTNVDFEDITLSGDNAPYGGTSIGDAGGNNGIDFTPASTRYWVGGTGNWYETTEWSTTSGGAGGASMPLPQDDVIFNSNSFNSTSQTVSVGTTGLRLGKNITWTGVTNNPTWSINFPSAAFGSITLTSGMSISSTSNLTLMGRSNFSITSANNLFTNSIEIDAPGGTYTLLDDFTRASSGNLTITQGTFDANDHNVSTSSVVSSNTNIRTIKMGSGTWNLTGNVATIWNSSTTTNLTLNPETSTIKLSGTLTANRSFSGGGLTFNNIWNATSGNFALVIVGSNTFNDFKINPGRTQQFTAGTTTTVNSFDATGTSGNEITITSATAANHNLVKSGGGIISGDYLNISRSQASPASTWYAGTNSIDGGNNNGWIFEAPNIPPNDPTDLGPSSLTDGSYTNDTTPTFEFKLSDDDVGDQVKYRIQVDNSSDFGSPVVDYTSSLAGQGERVFTVGQAAGSGSYSAGSEGQSLLDSSYYWRVMAIDENDEESDWSTANSGSVAFILDTTTPTVPGDPETTSPTFDTTQIWNWTGATDPGGSGIAYYAWRVINAVTLDPVVNGTTSFLTVTTNLGVGVYDFFVKAMDNAGNVGPESEGQVVVTTPTPTPGGGGGGGTSVPNAPSPSTCSATAPISAPFLYAATPISSTTIRLYFTDLTSVYTNYVLVYGTTAGTPSFGSDNIGGVGARTFDVNGLSPSTKYYFKIAAANGCAIGSYSNEIAATTAIDASFLEEPSIMPTKTETVSNSTENLNNNKPAETPSGPEKSIKKSKPFTFTFPKIEFPQISFDGVNKFVIFLNDEVKNAQLLAISIGQSIIDPPNRIASSVLKNLRDSKSRFDTSLSVLFNKEALQIKRVKVAARGSKTVTITWNTNKPSRSKINYGSSTSYGYEASSNEYKKTHVYVLDNLKPGKTYYFEVMNQVGNEYVYDAYYTFTTPKSKN